MTEYHRSANAQPNEYAVPPEDDEAPSYSETVAQFKKDYPNISCQMCDSCDRLQDQPGYTCSQCDVSYDPDYLYYEYTCQACSEPNNPDYLYYNAWMAVFPINRQQGFHLGIIEDVIGTFYVCPYEIAKDLKGEEQVQAIVQWAKNFQAL